jgi:hypothetical protein
MNYEIFKTSNNSVLEVLEAYTFNQLVIAIMRTAEKTNAE